MSDLLPFIITGVATGSLYGLAGLGLVLTYRTSGVFNLGHGAIAAAAAFVFHSMHNENGVPWPIALVVTLALFAVVGGWLLERLSRGLGDVPEAVVVVATVGLLLGIQGLLSVQYGNFIRDFPQFLPRSGFTVASVIVSWAQVITVAVATGAAVLLYQFLRRSRLGVAMRAVVDNPTLVSLAGDNPLRIGRAAWAIGSAFAALSGILLAPTLGLDALLLTLLVVQAFGACAIGMFQNLPLTYLGGIVVGVSASLATKFFTDAPWSGLPPAMPFVIVLIVLLVVPPTRFPRRRASLRSLMPDRRPLTHRAGAVLAVPLLVGILLIPALDNVRLPIWTAALSYFLVFVSLGLLVWTSGQISLCHAAFVAVGAVAMAQLTTDHGIPWGVALILSGLITVPVGAIVAVPALRLPGIYLALATLGFGLFLQKVFYPASFMFDSELAVSAPRPSFGPLDGTDDTHFFLLVLAIALCGVAAVVAISRSRLGRLLRALAETPTMLSTHGLGVNVTRFIVFCISAFIAGVAGGLIVSQFGSVSGTTFDPIRSLMYLAVLAICGTGLIRSALLAALLFSVVPGYMTSFNSDQQTLAFGAAAVVAGLVIAKRDSITDRVLRVSAPRDSPLVALEEHLHGQRSVSDPADTLVESGRH